MSTPKRQVMHFNGNLHGYVTFEASNIEGLGKNKDGLGHQPTQHIPLAHVEVRNKDWCNLYRYIVGYNFEWLSLSNVPSR